MEKQITLARAFVEKKAINNIIDDLYQKMNKISKTIEKDPNDVVTEDPNTRIDGYDLDGLYALLKTAQTMYHEICCRIRENNVLGMCMIHELEIAKQHKNFLKKMISFDENFIGKKERFEKFLFDPLSKERGLLVPYTYSKNYCTNWKGEEKKVLKHIKNLELDLSDFNNTQTFKISEELANFIEEI